MAFTELPPIEWVAPSADELAAYKAAADLHKVINQAPSRVLSEPALIEESAVIEANWLLEN